MPFGYQLSPDGVSLIADLDGQRTIRILWELRQAGNTLNQIADELNQQGFRTRRGSAWQIHTVHHLLRAADQRPWAPVGGAAPPRHNRRGTAAAVPEPRLVGVSRTSPSLAPVSHPVAPISTWETCRARRARRRCL